MIALAYNYQKKCENTQFATRPLLKIVHLKADSYISINQNGYRRKIRLDSIVYCRGCGNYTHVMLDSLEEIVVSRPIVFLEKKLHRFDFIRCHQSHLIRVSAIDGLKSGKELNCSILGHTFNVPVSRRKRSILSKYSIV